MKFRLTCQSFYVYIKLKETNIPSNCFQFNFFFKENDHLLKCENWTLKIYISELSNIIPILFQLLIPDLVFPVYKIDHENIEKKTFLKELLKLPNKYSGAVVFENFLNG